MTIIKILTSCVSAYFITGIVLTILNMCILGLAYSKERNMSFIDGFIAVGDAIGFMRMTRVTLLWPDAWYHAWILCNSWIENDVHISASEIIDLVDAARSKNL